MRLVWLDWFIVVFGCLFACHVCVIYFVSGLLLLFVFVVYGGLWGFVWFRLLFLIWVFWFNSVVFWHMLQCCLLFGIVHLVLIGLH